MSSNAGSSSKSNVSFLAAHSINSASVSTAADDDYYDLSGTLKAIISPFFPEELLHLSSSVEIVGCPFEIGVDKSSLTIVMLGS